MPVFLFSSSRCRELHFYSLLSLCARIGGGRGGSDPAKIFCGFDSLKIHGNTGISLCARIGGGGLK